ncbi:MAG: AAA family ATPase [Anaerolineae bacterium]|nr:AAA family ATPase [Anaerolineae bacterium]
MARNEALIQALRTAIAATPENAALRKHLGDLLLEAGDFATATQEYRQALDIAPEDSEIKRALAEGYFHQGKVEVALVILEELLRAPAPEAETLLLAARVYLQTGAEVQAAQAYQQAVALNPNLADTTLEAQLRAPAPTTASSAPATEAAAALFGTPAEAATPPPGSAVERPDITFANVGGMEELKEEIRMKILYPLTNPELYKAYGKRAGGGILMYGPPGCGKTFLARATAGEVRANFISVGLHDILDMWLGNSEKNLHEIFVLARKVAPCVLFFDEVDALGASRTDLRHSAGRHVINQFLSELDGVDTSNEGVLILAATNAPWHLDPAFRRPGRFDRVLFVPPPDTPARAAILQLHLADKPTERLDFGKLARMTEGFSGADLMGVVDQAVERRLREALRSGKPTPVTMGDLQEAIKQASPTVQEWFATAKNYAIYANEGGAYDDVLEHLRRLRM